MSDTERAIPSEPADDTTGTDTTPTRVRPRLRVAAIVWGILLAALGLGAVWLVWDPAIMRSVTDWIVLATPAAWAIAAIVAVLAIGVVILIGSLLRAVHRAQDRGISRP